MVNTAWAQQLWRAPWLQQDYRNDPMYDYFAQQPGANNPITPPTIMYDQGTGQGGQAPGGSRGVAWGSPPSVGLTSGTKGNLGGQLGQAQDPGTLIGRNADGSPIVPNRNPYGWTWGGDNGQGHAGQTAYTSGAGAGASRTADGGYRLPSGEVLPAYAHSTVDIGGKQVIIPGYYDPAQDKAIFQNGTTAESAMGRLTRRLKDDAANGLDPSDPNVIYREMARIRDEAGARGGETGFVHLDRFVRGANGETGFQGPQGANTAYQATNAAGTPPPASAKAPVAAPQATAQTTPPASGTTGSTTSTTGGNNVSGYNPGTGGAGGASVPNGSGQGGSGYGPASAAAIAQDPSLAYRALLQSQGKTYAPRGMFTSFRENLFGNALSAYINMLTSGGGQTLDNINGILSNFGNAMNGGNFYGSMADTARNAMSGLDLGALDPSKVDQLVKQVMGLETMGLSPFAQNAAQNRYKDTVQLYEDNALNNDMNETQNYGDFMKSTPFWNALGALTGR